MLPHVQMCVTTTMFKMEKQVHNCNRIALCQLFIFIPNYVYFSLQAATHLLSISGVSLSQRLTINGVTQHGALRTDFFPTEQEVPQVPPAIPPVTREIISLHCSVDTNNLPLAFSLRSLFESKNQMSLFKGSCLTPSTHSPEMECWKPYNPHASCSDSCSSHCCVFISCIPKTTFSSPTVKVLLSLLWLPFSILTLLSS